MPSRWKAVLFSSLLAALLASAVSAGDAGGGPRIGRVTWEGLARLDQGAVAGGSLLRRGEILTEALLDLELARLDSLLTAAGLMAAEAVVDTLRRSGALEVRVAVFEGEPARIGELSVTGSDLYGREEILERLGVASGAVFDPRALEGAMLALLADLNNTGYPFAQVWITGIDFRRETGSVDLAFAVYGGEQTRIAALTFEGLAVTDSTLARRISRLRPGRAYDERAVRRSTRHLVSSGLFAEVRPARVERIGPGAVDVRIPLRELERRNSIQGLLGFSRRDGGEYRTAGSVDLDLVNIGGTGRDARLRWLSDGEEYRTTWFRYSEPFFLRLPVGLDVELRQDVFDTLYDFSLAGFDLTAAAGPAVSLSAGFMWDGTVPGADEALQRSVRHRLRAGCEVRAAAAAARVRLEAARKTNYRPGAQRDTEMQFLYSFEGRVLVPVFEEQAFFARAAAEGVLTPNEIPPSEMYSLGGARSLRGYRENQFRGRQTAWLNLEYRFGGESRLFVFDDVGVFQRSGGGWLLRNGLGFGLRSTSKLGTVEMSFGVGERFALDQTRIHVLLIENF